MSEPLRAAAAGTHFDSFADFYRTSAYSAFPQEHRQGGSLGQSIFTVDQEPIDFIDSAAPDLVFCIGTKPMTHVKVDTGDELRGYDALNPGALVVYPAHAESRTFVSVPHQIINFIVPQAHVDTWLDAAGLNYDPYAGLYGHINHAPQSLGLIQSIWRAAESPHGADNLLIDGLTMQLLANLAQQGRDQLSMADVSGQVDRRLRRAMDYIEAHLNTAFGVAELADVACLSPTHFSRAFKAATGETVWAYVRRLRVERAQRLLIGSDQSIAQISDACGFSDASHLTRAVKAALNITPGQLRASARL